MSPTEPEVWEDGRLATEEVGAGPGLTEEVEGAAQEHHLSLPFTAHCILLSENLIGLQLVFILTSKTLEYSLL